MGWEIALMAVGTGLSAVQTIQAGREREKAEEIRQRQLEADKRRARIQELQERTAAEKNRRALASRNRALAAAKGFDFGVSESFLAIEEEGDRELERDIGNIIMFGNEKRSKAENSIMASKAAASAARQLAFTGAARTLFSGGYDIYKAS